MNELELDGLRAVLSTSLRDRGDRAPFSDDCSLFASGRLDSLAMIGLITHLEQDLGLDFSAIDFDVGLVDSVREIAALVVQERRA